MGVERLVLMLETLERVPNLSATGRCLRVDGQ